MKVIVAGSRHIEDYEAVKNAIHASGFHITELISGKARGVDRLGEDWANSQDPPIPITPYPANWGLHGRRRAGPIRNGIMAYHADALVLVWDGVSTGSSDMLKKAKIRKLKIYEVIIDRRSCFAEFENPVDKTE